MREKSNFLAYIFLLLTVTFWAGNFIVGKFASHYEVPPFSLNFYRWFFAWLILAPFTISEILKKKGNLLLSISPMTLTHSFATIILLEQHFKLYTPSMTIAIHCIPMPTMKQLQHLLKIL